MSRTRHLWPVMLLLATLSCREQPVHDATASSIPEASQAPASAAVPCNPTVAVLDPNVHLQIANEFGTFELHATACRASLAAATSDQKKAIVAWLSEYTLQHEREIRICGAAALGPPPEESLQDVKQHIRGLSDWCWGSKSSSVF